MPRNAVCKFALGAAIAMASVRIADAGDTGAQPLFCANFLTVVPPDPCSNRALLTWGADPVGPSLSSAAAPKVVNIDSDSRIDVSDWLALAAIVISVLSVALSHYYHRMARQRSVRDDFWVRQVAYPYVLQPSLDLVEWCITNMPEPGQQTRVEEMRSCFMAKRRIVIGRIATLREIERTKPALWWTRRRYTSNDMADKFDACMESLQDTVMAYLAELDSDEAKPHQHRQSINAVQEQAGIMIGALACWQRAM